MRFQFAARFSARVVGMVFVLLLSVASQASAATIVSTYTGTVGSAFDTSGVFGTPGANLAGANYKLVFTTDSAAGAYATFNGTISDPLLSGDSIFGGSSAALSINGHSYAFTGTGSPGGNFDIVGTKPGFGVIAQQFSVFPGAGSVSVALTSTNPSPGFPTSVYTSFVLSSCPTSSCLSNLVFDVPGGRSGFFHGSLNFGSLSVTTAITTTPIPATLPLLVSALGGLGYAGWRRKQNLAA